MFFDADSAYVTLAETTENRRNGKCDFIEGAMLGWLIKRWLRR
jgi:hypothetical protein